jgi:histone deacetylase 11
LTPKHFIKPPQASQQELRLVHTDEYLQTLRSAKTVARIAELPLLSYLPDGMLYRRVIVPMEYATGGTLLGIELALEHFWAINLSGGYHHAKASAGEGFCYISDIAVAISKKWQDDKNLRVLIIDLDAHQGNGIASIFRGDRRVDILDIYNSMIYPRDIEAQSYITYGYPLSAGTQDQDYLATLRKALSAMEGKSYDLIIYNAGTDILKGDPLGRLAVSQEGVIKRDELVFSWARKKGIPILMLLSGGYTSRSGLVIGRSIVNLWQKSLLLQ